ncbi:MAG: alpha/beta fold hydrolase [Mobilicoccus sp.]|nr:alpha/beta fold hydrolase [Mobilicoccus sp.]
MSPRLVPPGADVRHVDVPVGRLRVLHAGAATERDPVVLVHGGGSDNAGISWHDLLAPLGADREVWAPDLPGFGGSVDVEPVGGPEAMAEVVRSVMDAVGVPRAVVMGVSMGGDVALNLALHHPGRVSGLVLIAPGGLASMLRNRPAQAAAWAVAQLPDRVMLPATRLLNRLSSTALRAMVADPARLPPAVVEEFLTESRHPRGSRGYLRYNQATLGRDGMRNDLMPRVHEITAPTLFVHGEDDPLVSPLDSARAAQRMHGARLVLVPNCGHWAQLEAHDEVFAEIRGFLAAVSP